MNSDIAVQLNALIKLAELDAEAKTQLETLEAIPRELEERRKGLEKLAALVEAQRRSLDEAEATLKLHDDDLATRNEILSKSKGKGARAQNAKEVDAAEKELESIRRGIKDAEGERDKLRTKLEDSRKNLVEPEAMLAQLGAELAEADAQKESRLAALKAEIDGILKGRSTWAALVEPSQFRHYDRVRGKLGTGLADLVGDTCQGCRMRVPSQNCVIIRKGAQILTCHSCRRVLVDRTTLPST